MDQESPDRPTNPTRTDSELHESSTNPWSRGETPQHEAVVDALLSLYLKARQQQQPLDAQALCPSDTPEIFALLQERIAEVERVAGRQPDLMLSGQLPEGYLPIRQLGRGGMGVVYQAWDQMLNRMVAIKMLLHGHASTREWQLRFKVEAKAIARINHEGIVQLFHAGMTPDERPYLVMEYCRGGTLADRLRNGPLSSRDAAELVSTLADSVEAAHFHGVIHRDLKPGNVLFTAQGRSKVADFGLAKQFDTQATVADDLTGSGRVMGTPGYMAPEQAGGDSHLATSGMDVWALGVILYECLSGVQPFRGKDLLETFDRIAHAEPKSLLTVAPGTPRDLETICLKCLRKNPYSRYASAGQLRDDLHRFLRGESIDARPPSRGIRAARWAVRRWRTVSVIAFALGLMLASVLIIWLTSDRDTLKNKAATTQGELDRTTDQVDKLKQERLKLEAEEYLTLIRQADLAVRTGKFEQAKQSLSLTKPEQRNWEWYYLNRQSNLRLFAIPGDTVAFVPGANVRLIVGGENRKVGLFDALANRPTLELSEAPPQVLFVAASPTGKSVAATTGGELLVWDTATGRKTGSLADPRPGRPTVGVAFSPDGEQMAVSQGSEVLILKSSDLSLVTTYRDQVGVVSNIAFSSDGRWAISSGQCPADLWDTTTGRRRLTTGPNVGRSIHAVFSPDDRQFAVCSANEVVLFDVESGKESRRLKYDGKEASRLAFSPDGLLLLAGCEDGVIRAWNTETWVTVPVATRFTSAITGLEFSPDGRFVVSASLDGKTILFARPDDENFPENQDKFDRVVSISRSGRKAIVGPRGVMYQFALDKPIHQSNPAIASGDRVTNCEFSHDETRAFLEVQANRALLIDGEKGDRITSPLVLGPTVYVSPGQLYTSHTLKRIWFHPTRSLLFHTTPTGLRAVDATTGQVRLNVPISFAKVPNQVEPSASVHVSSDGEFLVVENQSTAQAWRLKDGQKMDLPAHGEERGLCGNRFWWIKRRTDHAVWIVDLQSSSAAYKIPMGEVLAVSPTQAHLVMDHASNGLTVWDLVKSKTVFQRPPGSAKITATVLSPDGQSIAIATDGRLEIWKLESGGLSTSFVGPAEPIALAFSADVSRLAVLSAVEQTVQLFDPLSGKQILSLETIFNGIRSGANKTPRLIFQEVRALDTIVTSLTVDSFATWHLGDRRTQWIAPESIDLWQRSEILLRSVTAEDWHESMSRRYGWQSNRRFTALFHANRLQQFRPDDWELLGRRARLCKQLGRGLESATLYEQLAKSTMAPGTVARSALVALNRWEDAEKHATTTVANAYTIYDWRDLALLHLHRNDVAGFRQVCREMRKRLGETNPIVVQIYCLRSDSAEDARPVWLETAAKLENQIIMTGVDLGESKALTRLYFRMGKYEECLQAFERRDKNWPTGQPDDWIFRGRAELQLGHRVLAQGWFEKKLQSPDTVPFISNITINGWQEDVELNYLFVESAEDRRKAKLD